MDKLVSKGMKSSMCKQVKFIAVNTVLFITHIGVPASTAKDQGSVISMWSMRGMGEECAFKRRREEGYITRSYCLVLRTDVDDFCLV